MLISKTTEDRLARLQRKPPHAVALIGSQGLGKRSLAVRLASDILEIKAPYDSYPYIKLIEPGKTGHIGIESIRQIEHFLSLSVPVDTPLNRAVIIADAEEMGEEAQNALLKTLEEPADGTIIILTCSNQQALLPTVRSRVQTVHVEVPRQAETSTYFAAKGYGKQAIDQAYAITGGLPAVMAAMLEDGSHPLLAAAGSAKELVQARPFTRLSQVDTLAKDKGDALRLLYMLQQMAHLALLRADGAAADRWRTVLEASYKAEERLGSNANAKLVLTELMLAL